VSSDAAHSNRANDMRENLSAQTRTAHQAVSFQAFLDEFAAAFVRVSAPDIDSEISPSERVFGSNRACSEPRRREGESRGTVDSPAAIARSRLLRDG
jgi:hypothetical protein